MYVIGNRSGNKLRLNSNIKILNNATFIMPYH